MEASIPLGPNVRPERRAMAAKQALGRLHDGGVRRHAEGGTAHGLRLPKFLVLRQVVGDREPRCLGANEDVSGGPNGGAADERAQGDVRKRAFSDD